MSHTVTIGGKQVALEWSQRSARNLRLRASRLGVNPAKLFSDLSHGDRAEYAAAALLWVLVPDDVYRLYPSPEDLWAEVPEDCFDQVPAAIVGVVSDITPDSQKKSTLKKSRSPRSS